MTQFGPSGFEDYAPQESPYAPPLPKPWSASAIAGFVLSLAGCLGITAILGLIFGIVGIVRTKNGRRRGMGLAIAALPISLATGALSILLFGAFFLIGRVATHLESVQAVLATDPAYAADAVAALRRLATAEFNAAVSDEQLTQWVERIRTKHGSMTGFAVEEAKSVRPAVASRRRIAALNIPAQFVNGPVALEVAFAVSSFTDVRIDDLAVDGSSPRPSRDSAD